MTLRQPRTVALLAVEELKKLPTHRILAYRDKLLACENSVSESDLGSHEVTVVGIVFKDSEAWKKQYAAVKSVLADKPNIERQNRKVPKK